MGAGESVDFWYINELNSQLRAQINPATYFNKLLGQLYGVNKIYVVTYSLINVVVGTSPGKIRLRFVTIYVMFLKL